MSQILTAAGNLVDRIKINRVVREQREGRAVWIKTRRRLARPILNCANRFFRMVDNPVQAITDLAEWQRWEVECFQQLHGETFRAFAEGARCVVADEMPGVSLSKHLTSGTLTPTMLAAAGRELRRAHEMACPFYQSRWSHGDPHVGNFIFAPDENRARLIDFEVRHHRNLSADERHADDLLVLLQDVMGRVPADVWVSLARAFFEAYGRQEVLKQLGARFVAPRGLSRIWWAVRTTYLAPAELGRRIEMLRVHYFDRQ